MPNVFVIIISHLRVCIDFMLGLMQRKVPIIMIDMRERDEITGKLNSLLEGDRREEALDEAIKWDMNMRLGTLPSVIRVTCNLL